MSDTVSMRNSMCPLDTLLHTIRTTVARKATHPFCGVLGTSSSADFPAALLLCVPNILNFPFSLRSLPISPLALEIRVSFRKKKYLSEKSKSHGNLLKNHQCLYENEGSWLWLQELLSAFKIILNLFKFSCSKHTALPMLFLCCCCFFQA